MVYSKETIDEAPAHLDEGARPDARRFLPRPVHPRAGGLATQATKKVCALPMLLLKTS